MNYQLRQYILDNRDKYTRPAITAELIRHGYDPAVIEETWNQLAREVPTFERSKRSVAYPEFWLALLGVFFGVPLVLVLTGILFNGTTLGGIAPLFTFGVALAAAIIGASVTRQTNLPLSRGLQTGLICLVLLPFVAVIIVLGICLTAVYQVSTGL